MTTLLDAKKFLIRRKVLTLTGASFHVYDASGQLLGFSRQKAFRLKEDIRIYADEAMKTELLSIAARQVVDFSAAYDVVDAVEGKKVGACRRKGFTSIVRDSWQLLDDNDQTLGTVIEDSAGLALLRRFVGWIPQRFHVADGDDTPAAHFRQFFNPFVYKLEVTIANDNTMDPRLILGAAVLIAAIEGRQG